VFVTKVFKVNPSFILIHLSQGVDASLFPFRLSHTVRGKQWKRRLSFIRTENVLGRQ